MKWLLILVLLFAWINTQLYAVTVLLDPGHGGSDTGAKMFYSYVDKNGKKRILHVLEKDLSLIFAKKIQEKLKKQGVIVHLSRSYDHEISLDGRAELAQKLKADLFISIHMNASTNRMSKGFETFYLDNHNDVAIKKVEDIENVGLTGDQLIIKHIITDLIVERTAKASRLLAETVHAGIKKKTHKSFKIKDRGIKPGLFYVLAMAKRPGILLEVSFLSNPKELKKVLTPEFQEAYSKAVADGVISYLRK